MHAPVLCSEIISFLNLSPGKIILDCTIGSGGHAYEILKAILPGGRLIGIDCDQEALEAAKKKLAEFNGHFDLICDNFANLESVLDGLNMKRLDGCVLDLGVSSMQLENSSRGFSIKYNGPLDMRMDKRTEISALGLVNGLNEYELVKILREFGEERFSKSVARGILRARSKNEISTTWELARVVAGSIPPRFRNRRIHPATKTFQALRIAVNRELENLESILETIPAYLGKSARLCVISFHSLEDRIVKNFFKGKKDIFMTITKKPIRPKDEEITNNARARSAKLRVAEKI